MGPGGWDIMIAGLDWLAANGFRVAVAGRSCWGETEEVARAGYRALFAERGWPIDANSGLGSCFFRRWTAAASARDHHAMLEPRGQAARR